MVWPQDGCTLWFAASVYVLHDALADLLQGFRAVRCPTVGKEKCAWRREQSSGSTRTRASGSLVVDDGGQDVFVHFSAIESNGYRSLEENQRVEFDVTQGQKGPQAEHVRPI